MPTAFLYISSANLCDAVVNVCVADSIASGSVPSIAFFSGCDGFLDLGLFFRGDFVAVFR